MRYYEGFLSEIWCYSIASCCLLLSQHYVSFKLYEERKAKQVLLLISFLSMATTVPPQTWQNGYMAPSKTATWETKDFNSTQDGQESHYVTPPSKESLSSTVHNSLGLNVVRTWPTLFNGTESPHGISGQWKPAGKIDVLICGGTSAKTLKLSNQKLNVPCSWTVRPRGGSESSQTRCDFSNHW